LKITLVSKQTGHCSELRGGRFQRLASISNVRQPFGGIWVGRCLEVSRYLEGPLWEVPLYIHSIVLFAAVQVRESHSSEW
jgi:hypothetical protein